MVYMLQLIFFQLNFSFPLFLCILLYISIHIYIKWIWAGESNLLLLFFFICGKWSEVIEGLQSKYKRFIQGGVVLSYFMIQKTGDVSLCGLCDCTSDSVEGGGEYL